MGFFDLVNIRAINGKLNDLMPVVEANLSRLSSHFDNNFKVTKRYKNGLNSFGASEEVIETTQQHIDELLRLKKEFECEFEIISKIVDKIKPITFLDDDRSYVNWHNKLASISWGYNFFIAKFNKNKIYIKS